MGERMPTREEFVALLCRLAIFSETMIRHRTPLASIARHVATHLWIVNAPESDDTRRLRDTLARIDNGEFFSQEPSNGRPV